MSQFQHLKKGSAKEGKGREGLSLCCLILVMLLAACSQVSRVSPGPEEGSLFTDTDIDHAELQVPAKTLELVGLDNGELATGETLPAMADRGVGELNPQDILPTVSNFIFYVKSTAALQVGKDPYSLYRHNQQTNAHTLIYSGNRQIQSVAGSVNGTTVIVSMRETASANSDYELFLLSLSPNTPGVSQLSNDSVNNINVSMGQYSERFVYEEPVNGRPMVVIMTKHASPIYSKIILNSTLPQRQPSISGDNRFVSLVRDLANGSDRVLIYDTMFNSYLTVATSTSVLEHPSLSNDGLKVLWLANDTTDQIVLKNLISGTTQSVVSGATLGHPFLTVDGNFITYQSGRAVMIKDLQSAQVQTLASSPDKLTNYYAPMWQKTFENRKSNGVTSGGRFGSSVALDGVWMVVGAPGVGSGSGSAYVYQRNASGWGAIRLLTPSDATPGSLFGNAVAISGDTVVVGSKFKDGDRGAAYIFQKDQGGVNNWGQVKKIVASDGAADDRFGGSVAISGDTVVISAYFEDHDTNGVAGDELNVGAAYVYQRNLGGTNNWGERKKLTAGDHTANDWFGCGVGLSGTTVIVGACGESHDADGISGDEFRVGAAYIFEQNQGGTNTFGQVKKLVSNDGGISDQVGFSVAISGTTAVVSAYSDDRNVDGVAGDELNVGSAYIFQKDQGGTNNWGQVKKLVANDGATWDLFGHAVSISGNSVVVGAYLEAYDTNNNGTDETRVGAAYLFQRDQGGTDNWGQVRKLTAFDGAGSDSFSEGAVSISGGVVLVGAWSDDNTGGGNAGAIYFYE